MQMCSVNFECSINTLALSFLCLIMLIYVCLLTPIIAEAAKILAVFPAPCHSHQVTFRPLTQELARRGHDVTVITPFPAFPDGQMKNLKEISIANSINNIMNKDLAIAFRNAKDTVSQQVISYKGMYNIFEGLFENELKEFVANKEHFDVIFAESCARLTLVFSHIFKAPLIQISSNGGTFDTFEMVGAPNHPFLYPLGVGENFVNLSVLDKVVTIYRRHQLLEAMRDRESKEDKMVRKYLGDDFPSLSELRKNVDMVFLNVHPLWDSNRPVPPNVIYLGGLHLQREKELPEDLKTQLESSPRGVIYMSFGSTIRSSIFKKEKLEIFIKVLSKMPYTVFLKWDVEIEVPHNIIVRKWFPQADLLRHPNIKLFITQGGLQSIDEAIEAGVPMVGIPMLWDQFYNVHKIVELQLGTMCDIHTVDEGEFGRAIEAVLSNKSYSENVRNYRKIIHDQPQTSLERAVWWTEHVIRHNGAKHLRSPAFELSDTHYYEINVVLSVVAVIVVLFLALNIVLFKCLKLFLYVMRCSKVKFD